MKATAISFPTLAAFFELHRYDDVSWVESWLLSPWQLAALRALLAGWITAALKYKLYVFYQKGLLTRFLFYLTNLSCGSMVVYLVSMAVLGWRDQAVRLDRPAGRGWAGWSLQQLYVVNWCLHPLVTAVFWSVVVRWHHVDSALKMWKEATLHGLPLLVLVIVEFLVSNRRFICKRDWIVPTAVLSAYGGWMELAGLLHPNGGQNGQSWHPYPEFGPGTAQCWLYYGAALGTINVVFYGVYRLHAWKAGRFDDHTGWRRHRH